MREIFAVSQGIPRRINAVCDRLMLAAFLGELRRVSADLVGQIVSEMREEQVTPTPVAAQAASAVGGVASSVVDLQRLLGDAEAARALAAAGPAFDMARFDERLALVERTLSSTLNALGQLLNAAQAERDGSKEGGAPAK